MKQDELNCVRFLAACEILLNSLWFLGMKTFWLTWQSLWFPIHIFLFVYMVLHSTDGLAL